MQPMTHLRTNGRLVGSLVRLSPGSAVVRLAPTADMEVDHRGLVHGGFVFGLADYAAMLAVNDPNVVLGAAETRFLAPVTRGVTLRAEATVSATKGRKRHVDVQVFRGEKPVMTGRFTCFVLDAHVLGAEQ
ncbi:MAG: PaaI family thioesterase [Myxococcales bacterium]|nr:PaaI family thioesterase [Myxococcales bacterium]